MSEEEKKLEERKKMNAPFIRAIEWYRKQHNLTQKKMSELLRCNSPLISDYKNGKKLVGPDMKQRIAELFKGKKNKPKQLGRLKPRCKKLLVDIVFCFYILSI